MSHACRLIVWLFFLCGTLFCIGDRMAAEAAEVSDDQNGTAWLSDLDKISRQDRWEDIDSWLEEIYGKRSDHPRFADLVKNLASGDAEAAVRTIRSLLYAAFAEEIGRSARIAGQILAFGLLGAVFVHFSQLFSETRIADVGNLFTYLLLFGVLAAAFQEGVTLTGEILERQTEFMKVLLPAYAVAAVWAGSGTTAAAWMQVILFLIACVENFYRKLLIPFSQIYVLLVLVGNLSGEDMLSGMTALIRDMVRWGTRSLAGVVLGFQVVQGMVLPYADSLQTAGIRKLLQFVPGIGAGVGTAARMVLGAGVLIKNAVGAAGVIMLVMISAAPLIKLAVIVVIYRLTAAVLQPVGEKRIAAAVCGVAEGEQLLLGILTYGMIIFIVAIALTGMGTNTAYLSS
ncbi:MAG: stage III sporulation protein AE [Clostridiales bacterium]|nr:stage III sporulation protein AE [Clostridiales bacterium]